MEFTRQRGRLIEVLKIVKGRYNPADIEDFFVVNGRDTRENPCKLKGKDSKIALQKNVFTIAAVNGWNSVPEDVVTSESNIVFKSKLDKHWAEFKYNMDFLNGNGHN